MEIEEKKQWHSPFCAAIELEFREDKDILQYEREHPLSKQPLQIDLLVIKKIENTTVKNEIGAFFLGHNIIEYKSPKDALDIDVFYKVLGYACIYKAEAEGVNKILDTDITISIFREAKPVKLLKQLSKKYTVEKKSAGIYRIEGLLFPIQILVTKKLDKKLHTWLHSLTSSLDYDDAEDFLVHCKDLKDSADRKNVSAILDFVSNINEDVFLKILKEDNIMTEAIKKLIEPELINLRFIIQNKDVELENSKKELENNKKELENNKKELENNKKELENNKKELENNKKELENNKKELENNKKELENNKKELADKDAEIERLKQRLMEITQ